MNAFLMGIVEWLQRLLDYGPVQNLLDAVGRFGGDFLQFVKDAVFLIDHIPN